MRFQKVLIANRGAIAVRIAQAVQEMGMIAVAVYSTPDANAPHVRACDEAYELPGDIASETYLDQTKIIALAQACGAQAIHPGYGFLSENAHFAKAVRAAGLEFIGPDYTAIESMGSKTRAREMMANAGVPIVPAYQGDDCSVERLTTEASRIGYPVLVKAAAGGGGKGMKVVRTEAELSDLVDSAKREAQKAFGDATIFLKKYFEKSPSHRSASDWR
ncbi:MAG: hypothetical protein OEM52_13605 [bacterium]|nr:hypothetical protein [bacterium]